MAEVLSQQKHQQAHVRDAAAIAKLRSVLLPDDMYCSILLLETSMVDRQPCMMCDTTVGVTQLDA
jgi:hypothetical protein